jgi:hypothetical protein
MNTKELLPSIVKASKTLNKPLTQALRKNALSAGWPVSLTKRLRVVMTDSSMDIEYPEDIATRIEDLEYGDGTTPPMPVFRKFAKNNKLTLEDALVDVTTEYLFDSEILP